MTTVDYNKLLMRLDQDDRTALLTSMGGLRGLFDPVSHEFHQTDIGQKLQMLTALCEAHGSPFPVHELEEPFVVVMRVHGYSSEESGEQFKDAVCRLLSHAVLNTQKRKKVAK